LTAKDLDLAKNNRSRTWTQPLKKDSYMTAGDLDSTQTWLGSFWTTCYKSDISCGSV